MSVPIIQPRALFGLRASIPRNVFFVTDMEVLYPCGAVIIIHKFTEKRQKYIKLMEKSVRTDYIAISPKRTMCAIVENTTPPQVLIYDLESLKRKRTLTLPADAEAKRIECIDFSHDGRYVMVLSGEPDWMMYSFNWERGKIETSVRANYPNNPTGVSRVICSPGDNSNVVLIGNGLFRMMIMQETVWRQYGYQKAEHLNITSCCFLGVDRILIGTVDGLLLLVEVGELKFTYEATVVKQISPKADKDEEEALAVGSATLLARTPVPEADINKDRAVRALIAFTRGFAYSCGAGMVYFFEKTAPSKYVRRNIYKIDEPDYREVQKEEANVIRHLDINPSESYLLATTYRSHIYSVKLWGLDYSIAGEVLFTFLCETYHSGPVGGLATCIWKPIFMTCGAIDRTIRIWNYDTETIEMMKQYQEDIHGVSLHPTGLYAAVGFSDKLRFMTVMIDDLEVIREFPIRECALSSFGNMGHYLGAVNRDIIQVYSCVTFQIMAFLKGHNAKVTGLAWSTDDRKLVSCGTEGAVYEWDMTIGKRVGEVVTKGISHTGCCLTSDAKFIYVAGQDGVIREIFSSNITRTFDMNHKNLTGITLARSDLMMFVCSKAGSIFSLKMPLSEPMEYTNFQYHHSPITGIKLSMDDLTLITTSTAGVVGVWKLSQTEGRTIPVDKDFAYFNEILISQNDLEEKLATIRDLTQRMHELEMEHEYQMRHIEATYKDKMKDIHVTYTDAMDLLKENIEMLEMNHNTELSNITSDMNVMKERHEVAMLELEAKYNAQLIIVYDRYLALEEAKDTMIKDYEIKLAELEQSKTKTIESLTRTNESKLFNLSKMLDESLAEIEKERKDHDEMTRQIEDDNDREIQALRKGYEEGLAFEKESNIRLRGEAGVMKKKYLSAQKEISAIHMEIIFLESEQQKFKVSTRNLEKEISDLKKEVNERDSTIQDKERKIYDLKRRDQELERFKFVLNYKIKDLKNQIEPRDKEIREKKERISSMELELENLLKINSSLDINLTFMRDKLNQTFNSVRVYEKKYHRIMKTIKNVKIDIYNVSEHIQDFKLLQKGVAEMFHKYVSQDEYAFGRKNEEECQAEFTRQREYLERIVHELRRQVEKQREVHYGENMDFIEMNWAVMSEIYKIRKELKAAKRKVQDLELLLCFKTSKIYSPRKALQMVQEALKDPDEIRAEAGAAMEEATRRTELMKEEIKRLVDIYDKMKKDMPKEKEKTTHKQQKDFISFVIND
ncbi:UNVERIFIED_CONTAM: hypothetical protein PYX00_000691 [Menopon gallinae]|uniref:Cilia- and flagella-associated protein 57 n=1 Tax=Menopon gallinae TaxID=328185 RepID=A0AAW2IB07_9NEOP